MCFISGEKHSRPLAIYELESYSSEKFVQENLLTDIEIEKSKVTSNPIIITKSHKVSGNEVGQLVESLPNLWSHTSRCKWCSLSSQPLVGLEIQVLEIKHAEQGWFKLYKFKPRSTIGLGTINKWERPNFRRAYKCSCPAIGKKAWICFCMTFTFWEIESAWICFCMTFTFWEIESLFWGIWT